MIPIHHPVTTAHARLSSYVTLSTSVASGQPFVYAAGHARRLAADALARLVIEIAHCQPTSPPRYCDALHEAAWRSDRLAALLDRGDVGASDCEVTLAAIGALEAIVAKPAKIVRGVGAMVAEGKGA